MTVNLYSIHDKVAEEFNIPPFAAKNDAVACRMYLNWLKSESSKPSFNPADFDLWRVGSMSDTYPPVLNSDFAPVEVNAEYFIQGESE